MKNIQTGILSDVPNVARYLYFSLKPGHDLKRVRHSLQNIGDGEKIVIGLGAPLLEPAGNKLPDYRTHPDFTSLDLVPPDAPIAVWCWLRGGDRGELVHQTRSVAKELDGDFKLEKIIDAFKYGAGRDLTGYEDGTENPTGNDAIEAAFDTAGNDDLKGSSYVAVQQWVHDMDTFESMPRQDQDHAIGRRKSDNEELDDAPISAHVKRTAQESFSPEAFVLRRSMPWAKGAEHGLVFVAFGKSFYAFEAQMKQMVGDNDGVKDALFKFTNPISGDYFWCPPMKDGKLNLKAIEG
ncbi:MAG: Dyp-type peroxidase [bacterium]|nr:Dyp-type peroxidase [bacterium]